MPHVARRTGDDESDAIATLHHEDVISERVETVSMLLIVDVDSFCCISIFNACVISIQYATVLSLKMLLY